MSGAVINMNETKRFPELLCPAGSPEALDAALKGGADAVYLGGTQFNARMGAGNFDRDALCRAVDLCHGKGVRTYVTFNTLIYDRQHKEALNFVEFLYKTGVDALIMADLGFAGQVHREFPELRLHASTQCSGHNVKAAEFLHNLGFSRMVCARELSKENITTLCRNSPIEIEAFVHGALCVSASGQCLMSSVLGGRSGNRGECAQPCRLPYNGKYPLSLKDNCLARHITELIDMGVGALKIEGRMKSPDYVYSAASLYRTLLDEKRNATEREVSMLSNVFSRQGFTDGYFMGMPDKNMIGVRTDENKDSTRRQHVNIKDVAPEREPVEPLKNENTKEPSLPPVKEGRPATKTARFYNPMFVPELARQYFDVIYLPLDRYICADKHLLNGINGVVMPPVIPDNEIEDVEKMLAKARNMGAEHILLGNIGHIEIAKKHGFILHGDYRLNIYNRNSKELYSRYFEDVILSPELILPQIRDIKGNRSVIVYGKIPLMTLEKKVGADSLRDRKGVIFPIIEEGGRDVLFNSVPVYMADYFDKLKAAGIDSMHFIFTDEGQRASESVIQSYIKHLPTKKEIRRIK